MPGQRGGAAVWVSKKLKLARARGLGGSLERALFDCRS